MNDPRFRQVNRGGGRQVSINIPDNAAPNPQSPQPVRRIWVILTVLVVLCLVVSAGGFYLYSQVAGQPQTPTQQGQAHSPVQPNPTGQAQSTESTFPQVNKPIVNECIVAFGSYFSVTQAFKLNNPAYTPNVIPLQLNDANGNAVTDGTEPQQIQWMKDGTTCDILFTTSDTLAANVTMGKIIAIVDRSDGADFTRAWNVGRTPGIAGREIKYINDLKGGVIAVAQDSVSKYQALSWILAMGYSVNDIQLAEYPTMDEALAAFEVGKVDAVAGWLDTSDQSILANSKIVASTAGLHTIYDVIIVSPTADATKKPAVIEALADYFRTKKTEMENFDALANDIANWTYTKNGVSYDTNDWSGITKETPSDDFRAWLGTISEANFDHNITFMKNPGLVYEILKLNRKVLEVAGEKLEDPFIPENLYDPSYMAAIANRDDLRPISGTFVNTGFSPFPSTAQDAPDANKLVKLPTFIEFNCPTVNFPGGKAELDVNSVAYQTFKGCVEKLRLLINQSDAVILITGSAASPDPAIFGPQYTPKYSNDLARNRAIWAQTTMESLGIPGNRIAIFWTVGPLTQSQQVMHDARFVKMELKLDDSLR